MPAAEFFSMTGNADYPGRQHPGFYTTAQRQQFASPGNSNRNQTVTMTMNPSALKQPRESSLDIGIEDSIRWFEKNQQQDGFWVGRLETNCCMEAQWLLAFYIMDYDYPYIEQLIEHIFSQQRSDGSWAVYYDAPAGDINTTVECYAALRAYGLAADDERLVNAQSWIEQRGGLRKTRVFTRFWLALIGEWPWTDVPNLPPELIRFPRWFPFNIYNFASIM